MKRRLLMFTVALGLAVIAWSTRNPLSATEMLSDLRVLACHVDGYYVCGESCRVEPYNGRYCCEMP